jgi:trigger factor
MQVSVESSGTLGRTLKVEVAEEKVVSEVENRLKKLSKTTKIQGFRPGKVPFKMIRQRYGPQVRQEVVGEVVQSSFYEAITQEKLHPAGSPEIDSLNSELGAGIAYTAKFEILPEVKLADVGSMKIDKTHCELSDEDIDKAIETMRNQRKIPSEVDRAATEDDIADIDFTGTIDGEVFEGGESKGFQVELNGKRLIDGFESGLVGSKAGDELDLDLQFPDEYGVAELAGKPVKFQIKVNKIMESILPELDEEFLKQFGIEEGGLDAFKVQIREHMERESDEALRAANRDSVMEALFAANEVDLPVVLVDTEKNRIREQLNTNLKEQGIPVDEVNKAGDDSLFEEQARKRVSLQLTISELIKENDLKADPAKVRARIEKSAQTYQDPAAIISWYYGEQGRLADVEAMVLEDEVVDWILERAELTEVGTTFDDLMNKRQTESVE